MKDKILDMADAIGGICHFDLEVGFTGDCPREQSLERLAAVRENPKAAVDALREATSIKSPRENFSAAVAISNALYVSGELKVSANLDHLSDVLEIKIAGGPGNSHFSEKEHELILLLQQFDWSSRGEINTDGNSFYVIADSDEQVMWLDEYNGYDTIYPGSSWGFIASHLGEAEAWAAATYWATDFDDRYEDFWQMVADGYYRRLGNN